MVEGVKSRSYRSPLRERRAQETRKAILDAAERLFTTRGYVGTRLADVAADAGVSLATVKLVFGTKPNLLLILWHRTLAGGLDDGIPVAEREWALEQTRIADPVERMARSAADGLMIKQRIANLVHVIQNAAPVDDELAELWTRMQGEHRGKSRERAEQLRAEDALRPDLTVEDAGDIMWALNHVSVYRNLVELCGWSPERYQQWLADAMVRNLLDERAIRP